MPKGVNYPLYIPDSCKQVEALIESGRSDEAIAVLERKTAFGDTGAAALLGYLQIHRALPAPRIELIQESLRGAAKKGDPYAQFVFALGFAQLGELNLSRVWMERSANQLFAPAMAQLGRYMIHGTGYQEPCRESALAMYKFALSRKHLPSLAFMVSWLSSSPRLVQRLSGRLLRPVAFVVIASHFIFRPFSIRAFFYVADLDLPLFSRELPEKHGRARHS